MPLTTAFDRLLHGPVYPVSTPEQDSIFLQALHDELRFHSQHNPLYADFLVRKGVNVEALPNNLTSIPFIPVQVFKAIGTQLYSVLDSEVYTSLNSSATSGKPSTVVLDKITARRQFKAMAKVMSETIGVKRRPFYILDIAPDAPGAMMNARSAAIRAYLNYASKATYFVDEHEGQLFFNKERFAQAMAGVDDTTPVVIFAFTYVLYCHAVRPLLEQGIRWQLPVGSLVMHIGGWKKLESERVDKSHFTADVSTVLGVDAQHIIDIYGFTEQMGLNYPDCACGCKHTPAFSRVIVRDTETLRPLPAGQPGLLEFLSPVPHSYPGNVVLTDDIGVIDPASCSYGRGGTRFRILGRLKKAEIRGCGDIMGEKMKGTPIVSTTGTEPSASLNIRHYLRDQHQVGSISKLTECIREKLEWLTSQPMEAIVGLIGSVAATWMDNPQLAEWKYNGLAFLVRWCQPKHLRKLVYRGLRANPITLDRFCPQEGYNQHYLRALPRGLVCHWLAGNVPLLGMLVLVQGIISKNVNILKTSRNNMDVLDALLQTFKGKEYRTPGGNLLRGDDLLQTMALVYYQHNAMEYAMQLSEKTDVRVAWGGREAIDAICALPSKPECTDLVFGPKYSFMVIAKEAIATERALHKLLRHVATDVSVFDQMACSSPHTIFVEEGGCVSPCQFAEALGPYLEKSLHLIPKAPEDSATISAVRTAQSVGDFIGQCWHGKGASWTVLYNTEMALANPLYSRTVTIHPVQDILQAADLVHPGVQSIGLAAEGGHCLAFTEAAARRGAVRFPRIGVMTHFDTPWDGLFVIDKLVRWVTLGGPEM